MSVIDWERFLRLRPVMLKIISKILRFGFDFCDAYDAVFDLLLRCCQKGDNFFVNDRFVYLAALHNLCYKKGEQNQKHKNRKFLKAKNFIPVGALNEYDLTGKLYRVEIVQKSPRDVLEEKEAKYIFFDRVATYDEKVQKILDGLLDEKTYREISETVKLKMRRVQYLEYKALLDLKRHFEGKYGRGYSKFPSKR